MKSRPVVWVLAALAASSWSVAAPGPGDESPVDSFVTREGNHLLESGRPFRFISWNVPNLHVVEDPSWVQRPLAAAGRVPVYWHRVTREEQEDAVQTVVQMGGRVVRPYTLSVKGGRNDRGGPSHVSGPGLPLDEDLMRDYDSMVATCGRHGVRLIIPIIDEWNWFGGRREFAALYGGGDFFTDRRVVDAYKDLIRQLLTRVNTVTGIAYRDDPAIMAWETGNELRRVPRAWTAEIAAWIKAIAPRQLVADGANGSIESADDPNVDLLTDHYYDHGGNDYASRALRDQARAGSRRPFFIGEFGCTDPDAELGAMDATLRGGLAGALFWSLRFHSADGGFYWHREGGSNAAYHWPGFLSNAASGEARVLAGMRERAWAIRGLQPPPLPAPLAPVVLDRTTPAGVVWRGSVGAERYVLERSADGGPWVVVSESLTDDADPFRPFADAGAPAGLALRYRMRAVNAAGASPWSAAFAWAPR